MTGAVVEDLLRAREAQLYIVTGQCGEYSDTTWWVAAVATTREAAEAFVKRCDDWQAEVVQAENRSGRGGWTIPAGAGPCPDERVPRGKFTLWDAVEWTLDACAPSDLRGLLLPVELDGGDRG